MTCLDGAGQFLGSAVSRPGYSLANDPKSAIFAYREAKSRLFRPPMTPMPPLGYSKEPPFQARRDGVFRFFLRPFIFAQAPKKRAQRSIFYHLNTQNHPISLRIALESPQGSTFRIYHLPLKSPSRDGPKFLTRRVF